MKSIREQNNDAVMILFIISFICIASSYLTGCGIKTVVGPAGRDGSEGPAGSVGPSGTPGNTVIGPQGPAGANGFQGMGAGVLTQTLPGACSGAGGVQITTFTDPSNTGVYNSSIDTVTSVATVCNGVAGSQGTAGTSVVGPEGPAGSVGPSGTPGAAGNNGSDGTSTTFSLVSDSGTNCPTGGYDLTLTDGSGSQTIYVCNGAIGATGAAGASGAAGLDGVSGSNGGTVTFDLVQAIEPCGAASSPWKETLLGLQGGQILSDFSETASGQNTRLAFMPNGSYTDTDESGCTFSVSGDNSTWSTITWSAGSNAYSTWPSGGFSWTPAGGWVAI